MRAARLDPWKDIRATHDELRRRQADAEAGEKKADGGLTRPSGPNRRGISEDANSESDGRVRRKRSGRKTIADSGLRRGGFRRRPWRPRRYSGVPGEMPEMSYRRGRIVLVASLFAGSWGCSRLRDEHRLCHGRDSVPGDRSVASSGPASAPGPLPRCRARRRVRCPVGQLWLAGKVHPQGSDCGASRSTNPRSLSVERYMAAAISAAPLRRAAPADTRREGDRAGRRPASTSGGLLAIARFSRARHRRDCPGAGTRSSYSCIGLRSDQVDPTFGKDISSPLRTALSGCSSRRRTSCCSWRLALAGSATPSGSCRRTVPTGLAFTWAAGRAVACGSAAIG